MHIGTMSPSINMLVMKIYMWHKILLVVARMGATSNQFVFGSTSF